MNTAHLLATIQDQQIKKEIKQYTAPLWRRAIVVVCLIVVWVAIWRTIHVATHYQESRHADDSR